MEIKTYDMSIHALVKGNSLDFYDWDHEDKLTVMEKITDLASKNNIYLFQVYNHDKKEFASVSTDQIIVFDKSIFNKKCIMGDCKVIMGNGSKIIGILEERNK